MFENGCGRESHIGIVRGKQNGMFDVLRCTGAIAERRSGGGKGAEDARIARIDFALSLAKFEAVRQGLLRPGFTAGNVIQG